MENTSTPPSEDIISAAGATRYASATVGSEETDSVMTGEPMDLVPSMRTKSFSEDSAYFSVDLDETPAE